MTLYELVQLLKTQHSAMGNTIHEIDLLVPPPGPAATLVASPTSQKQGISFKVEWANLTGQVKDTVIGLYAPGAAAGSAALGWVYLNSMTQVAGPSPVGPTGFAQFPLCTPPCANHAGMPTDLAAGDYEFRLLAVKSNLITVTAAAPTTATLTVSPMTQKQGVAFNVTWTNLTNAKVRYWIELNTPGRADTSPIGWVYLNSMTQTPGPTPVATNGSAVFPLCAPPCDNRAGMATDIAPGDYDFRILDEENSDAKIVNSPVFTITAGAVKTPIITASLVIAVPGDKISANWKDIPSPTAKDWVGLFKQGTTNRLWWKYVNGTITPTVPVPAGSIPFTVPAGYLGMYEFRLFLNDTTSVAAAVSQPIEVKAP